MAVFSPKKLLGPVVLDLKNRKKHFRILDQNFWFLPQNFDFYYMKIWKSLRNRKFLKSLRFSLIQSPTLVIDCQLWWSIATSGYSGSFWFWPSLIEFEKNHHIWWFQSPHVVIISHFWPKIPQITWHWKVFIWIRRKHNHHLWWLDIITRVGDSEVAWQKRVIWFLKAKNHQSWWLIPEVGDSIKENL